MAHKAFPLLDLIGGQAFPVRSRQSVALQGPRIALLSGHGAAMGLHSVPKPEPLDLLWRDTLRRVCNAVSVDANKRNGRTTDRRLRGLPFSASP